MHKFCCSQFGDLLCDAGKKGFSAIPQKSESDDYVIFLQSRNQDIQIKEGKLTIIQQAISYCPFCGSKLSKVIKRNKEEIEFYAKKNSDFLI